MDWSGDRASGWGYGAMGVAMAVLVAVVVFAVVLAADRRDRRPPAVAAPPAGLTPQELLDARLARGEIDETEYTSRREALAAKAGT